MLCAIFAVLFGVSLLPGQKPLCFRFAERISDGIMPDGAADYCRRLTWIWFILLLSLSLLGGVLAMAFGRYGILASSTISPVAIAATFAVERFVRRRRFSVVFHTSGSTSAPKKIVKTFESLAKEVAFHRSRLKIDAETAFLATVEPDHMYGTLWRVMLPAAVGSPVDPDVILTPEALVEKMNAAKRVFLVTTPSFLKRFCAYSEQYDVPHNCITLTTSGSLLDAETSAAAKRVFGVAPLEIFGSTETGGVASRMQDGTPESEMWKVLDPVNVKTSADGRLVVRSPFSFKREYMMGDGVELSPDGRSFRLLGRKDRMVKIAEQRVSLPEMEMRMMELDGIEDAALVALEGEKGPYLGVAVVCSGEISQLSGSQAVLALRKRLLPMFPKGAAPKRYRFVDEIPRNAQGKVLVSALREMMS